ncbi:MAG TPA: Asd/ArgC dimerization domain-containing protein [Candidatus Acidoferrales bacterium]|nr:Asd/ArgC dimerization domain-containing protein [Candidatus Acidoferrales bacterium]
MPLDTKTCRLAIAGAASLPGRELKQLLEASRFASSDIRLVDEELAAGTLTEVAGEPAIIQGAEGDSFEGVQIAFFTGSPAFAQGCADSAVRAGARVVDLSGGLAGLSGAKSWIPALDAVLAPPGPIDSLQDRIFLSPSTPAIVACAVSAALAPFQAGRLMFVFFQPVSEAGQPGVEELESQTSKLLSFQPIGEEVFDAQVAFNLLERFGAASSENLPSVRRRISDEAQMYLHGRTGVPAIQLVHAPVFYSYAFTAYAEFAAPPDAAALGHALQRAGIQIPGPDDPGVSNLTAAGEDRISMSSPARDPNIPGGIWLWGAVDNFRLAASNAVRIAEKLV